ncbi:unnamed protein product, partial [Allacma fusca]
GIQEKDISEAVNTALNTPTLQENVKTMSRLFRDQPMSSIDTALKSNVECKAPVGILT